jgi:hypothetical protein
VDEALAHDSTASLLRPAICPGSGLLVLGRLVKKADFFRLVWGNVSNILVSGLFLSLRSDSLELLVRNSGLLKLPMDRNVVNRYVAIAFHELEKFIKEPIGAKANQLQYVMNVVEVE